MSNASDFLRKWVRKNITPTTAHFHNDTLNRRSHYGGSPVCSTFHRTVQGVLVLAGADVVVFGCSINSENVGYPN